MVAQLAVVQAALELLGGDVVPEAEGFEEVLVDDVGPGADDRVDHVVADHVDEHLLQARADQRAGQAEDDAALAGRGACGRRCRRPGPGRGPSRPCDCIDSTSGTTLCCLMSMCSMVWLRSTCLEGFHEVMSESPERLPRAADGVFPETSPQAARILPRWAWGTRGAARLFGASGSSSPCGLPAWSAVCQLAGLAKSTLGHGGACLRRAMFGELTFMQSLDCRTPPPFLRTPRTEISAASHWRTPGCS